jgi:hypothetical protein
MPKSDPPAKVATSDGLGPDPEAVRLVEYLKGYPRSDGIDAAIRLLSEQASDIAGMQALLKLQKSSYEREIEIEVAAERERWIAKAGSAYTEAHAIFNDPPSETAQEVRDLIEWHLYRMRHDEIEGPNVRAKPTDTAQQEKA